MSIKQPENKIALSEIDRARIKNYSKKIHNDPPPKVSISDKNEIKPDLNTVTKMAEALGTNDMNVMSYMLNQVMETLGGSLSNEQKANNALSILYSEKPKSELEGMLVTQMISIHNLAMDFMSRAITQNQTVDGVDRNINRASKLMRTFTMQVDALNRLRGNAQQKVTVEHVHVHEGGQAIVGQVISNPGEGMK